MFAVIFVVQPKAGKFDAYLELAGTLKPALEAIDGFIANERFASRRGEGRILSLSIWRDEKALIRWRTLFAHHAAQERGRFELFADYRLRVGEIIADTDAPNARPLRQQRLDETETGAAKAVTISEFSRPAGGRTVDLDPVGGLGLPETGDAGLVDWEVFDSIYAEGKRLLLASWRDAAVAGWQPRPVAPGALRRRRVRIIRDYGMTDRREAPQYYPDVPAEPDGR